MALAIDSSTPAVVVNTSATTATITTASFTPPAGSVLLVLWVCDEASGPAAPSITDNLGGHLTYSQSDWKRKADASPNLFGQAASWTAPVVSSAAMTVTVTSGSASGERVASLSVTVLTGADTVTPAGAHGKSGSASAAAVSQAYTASATGGQGFIAIADADVKGAQTGGTGTTVIGSGSILTNISYAFARRTSADDSAGVSNTLNTTLLGTSTDLAWVYVEVLPAGGSPSAVWLPVQAARRRQVPPPRRAHAVTVPAVAPFAAGFEQARRLRGLFARRARVFLPAPAQVVVAAPAYPPRPVRTRLRGLRLFRPRAVAPVPAQIVVVPPSYPPAGLRTRLRGLKLFRPRVVSPAPAQVVLTAPTWVPRPARAQWRPALPRRHDVGAPPVDQQQPPPQLEVRPRFRLRPVRARITVPPPPQAQPPLIARAQARVVRLWRRAVRSPVPAQVILIAPARAPQPSRVRRAQLAVRRHRGGVEGWMAPGLTVCKVHRPNTGTVARGATGTVTRPNTGTVEFCTCCT